MTGAFHPAKIGDIIYSLPAVHRRGGVEYYHIKRPEVAEYLKPFVHLVQNLPHLLFEG